MGKLGKDSPVEIWLSQFNMSVTCRAVFEDESTAEYDDPKSLSVRGAQREITGWLLGLGYEPVGRWSNEARDENEDVTEAMRQFRLKSA